MIRTKSIMLLVGFCLAILCSNVLAAQTATEHLTPVSLQLAWTPQPEFAGFYVAQEKGYYQDEGLKVTFKPGDENISPLVVLADDKADFAIAPFTSLLLTPAIRANVVNIAQLFQRSGMLEISWKESNISKPGDWRGKRVGTWGLGYELPLYAAMRKAGIDPKNKKNVTIVNQGKDMSLFLQHKIDAAQAMSYDEYYQILNTTNPKTGKKYTTSDLKVIDFNDVGTAMLDDGIYARKAWLKDLDNQEAAVKFLRASFKGWVFCRDNTKECVNILAKYIPQRSKSYLTWQLNEVNELIWPSPKGIGMMDHDTFLQTGKILRDAKIATDLGGVYRTDLAQKALAGVAGKNKKDCKN